MIIETAQQLLAEGIILYPDWNFSADPAQGPGPGPVNREVIYLTGTTTTGGNLGGVIDDPEGPEH